MTKKDKIENLMALLFDEHGDLGESVARSVIEYYIEHPQNALLSRLLKEALGEWDYGCLMRRIRQM